ncbi:hypothetical protein [Corynebacterium auriscanis]|nr:hypothetical protein [Corynebacterium auriscanis]
MTYNLAFLAIPPAGTRLRLPQMATLASLPVANRTCWVKASHQQG